MLYGQLIRSFFYTLSILLKLCPANLKNFEIRGLSMKTCELKDGKELVIRKAVREDACNIIDYTKTVFGETTYLTRTPEEFLVSVEEEEQLIEETNKKNNCIFLVAEVDNEIVGTLTFSASSSQRTRHIGEFGMSVKKAYWGLGVGSNLLSYLIEWAKETNIIRKINLKVREDNIRAIALYEKFGFKKEGTITRYFYVDRRFYSVIEMGLEID